MHSLSRSPTISPDINKKGKWKKGPPGKENGERRLARRWKQVYKYYRRIMDPRRVDRSLVFFFLFFSSFFFFFLKGDGRIRDAPRILIITDVWIGKRATAFIMELIANSPRKSVTRRVVHCHKFTSIYTVNRVFKLIKYLQERKLKIQCVPTCFSFAYVY